MQRLVAVLAAAQVHAVGPLDEERRAGVVEDEVRVVGALVHEALDDAQVQGGVAPRLDGDPLVGLRHGGGEERVDAHDLGAGLLGVGEVLPHLDLGAHRVAAEEQDVVRVHEVLGLGLVEPLDAAAGEARVRGVVERVVPLGAAQGVEEAHDEAGVSVERALRAAAALVVGVGERAEVRLGLLPLVHDELHGLVPRDALPLACAARGAVDALHGIADAGLGVRPLDARASLEARAVVEVGLGQHVAHVAVARVDVVLAERAAPAAGAGVLLLLGRLVSEGGARGKVRGLLGGGEAFQRHACADGGRCFDEASAS